jgi:hypothetical protein
MRSKTRRRPRVDIVTAFGDDVAFIAERMRPSDVAELAASSGRTPLEALTRAHRVSDRAWTVLVDGVPEAMFGVSTSGEDGCAWLLGTDWLDSKAALRPFAEHSYRYVAQMHKHALRLYNYVDARNVRSINWLLHLGFGAADVVPEYGKGKLPFVLMVRDHNV